MKVKLINIQAIANAEYDIPETGIVQIKGDNSNGKSIIIKAISDVVSMRITQAERRNALIRDGYEEGYICMEHAGKNLVVKLNRERNLCAVLLKRVNGEEVLRTFRDGGIEELISEFGFMCFDRNHICIQVHETYGPMPFCNTPDDTNGEIVEAVTEDITAKNFLRTFKERTHPKAREQLKILNQQIEDTEKQKKTMILFDYEKYEEYAAKMQRYYEVLKYAVVVQLPLLNLVPELKLIEFKAPMREKTPLLNLPPNVKFITTKVPKISRLSLPVNIVAPKLDSLVPILREIQELESGTCPTCGKRIIEQEV